MKIWIFNSILSCIFKCIRIFITVSKKKIIFGLFLINFLGACTAPTAMIGPAYTLTSSGNALQAGISYGSNQMVTSYTGKTPVENFQKFISNDVQKQKNIQKNTLESKEFILFVKQNVAQKNSLLKNSNQ